MRVTSRWEAEARSRRRAWGCPCDGVSHRLDGLEADREVEAERARIERIVGLAPVECPWFSLARPEVQEVAHLHRAREHGMIALGFGGDENLPARLAAGLLEYDLAVRATREHFDRLEADNRKDRSATAAVARLGLPPPVVGGSSLFRRRGG